MFGVETLEVAIGLVLIYLLCSLVCSAIKEWFARLLDMRGKYLEQRIEILLNSPDLKNRLYNHPIIKGIDRKAIPGKIHPAYIDSKFFAAALYDILSLTSKDKEGKDTFEKLENALTDLYKDAQSGGNLYNPLTPIIQFAKAEVQKAEEAIIKIQEGIENWFNTAMEQMSAWYKQKARVIIFCIAIVLAAGLNVDTLMIAKHLYADNTTREAAMKMAEKITDDELKAGDPNKNPLDQIDRLDSQMREMGMPFGWDLKYTQTQDLQGVPVSFSGWVFKILGLFITAMAVSMGAPFWLDLLRNLMGLRKGRFPSPAKEEKKDTP